MGKKLRVCVVGAGWPSWQHMKGYAKLDEVELVGLCDADEKRLHQIADEYGVPKRYTSYDEMLRVETPDIVSVCTPNVLHGEMSMTAMKSGAHVLCEKPMCVSSDVGREMIRVSRETGKVLMVGYQRRFSPEASYLKQLIQAGKLGEIYFARAHWVRRRGIPGMGGWFTTKKLSGGGSLIDIGVHVLDLALWFMDYPDPIDVRSSWGSRFGSRGRGGAVNSWRANYHDGVFDVDDYAMGFLNFGAGRSMMLQVSWASHIEKDDSGVELWGTEGGAKLSPLQVFTTDGDGHLNTTPAFPNVYPFDVSTAHFVNVIKGREPLACPPEEALQTIQVIERIYGAPDSHA